VRPMSSAAEYTSRVVPPGCASSVRWRNLAAGSAAERARSADEAPKPTGYTRRPMPRPSASDGDEDVLSGMYDHAKWLPLPTILMLLERAGFDRVLKVEPRMGTQGPRVLILAGKS